MARRGPKRKAGKRERSGRPKRTRDAGTPEGQQKRKRATTGRVDSSYPLDVLFAAGDITLGELHACQYFGFLRYACFGRSSMASVAYSGERPTGKRKNWSDEFIKHRRLDYERIRAGIADTQALVALDNMVVYEHMPAWTGTKAPNQKDVNEARILFAAIKRLAILCGYLPQNKLA